MTPTWFRRKGILSNENPRTVTAIQLARGGRARPGDAAHHRDAWARPVLLQQEASRTTDIIENAQRSIILLNDIRNHARPSRHDGQSSARSNQIDGAIAADARSYDPIATYQGERDGVEPPSGFASATTGHPGNRQRSASLEGEIDKSIDKLVAINTSAGAGQPGRDPRRAPAGAVERRRGRRDRDRHRAGLISLWLLRVLGRQRRLIVERVQFLRREEQRAGGLCRARGPRPAQPDESHPRIHGPHPRISRIAGRRRGDGATDSPSGRPHDQRG